MPVPTIYSESLFAAYLTSVLDKLAQVLDWTESDPRVREAVTDALLEYGESTIGAITTATGIRQLRALGRRAIWRAVVESTTGNYSFTDLAAQKFERQQVNAQAREMLKIAESDCLEWQPGYAVEVAAVRRFDDPYAVIDDSERVA